MPVYSISLVGKNCVFRLVEKSLAQKPYCRKFMPMCHDVPPSRRCAGEEMRAVISNIGGSRSLLITVTVQLTSTTLVVLEVY